MTKLKLSGQNDILIRFFLFWKSVLTTAETLDSQFIKLNTTPFSTPMQLTHVKLYIISLGPSFCLHVTYVMRTVI